MIIATWNLNSIRARLPLLLDWLARRAPDVVCLQELKCTEDAFPTDALAAAGYHCAVFGQKTYNGVAILAREPLTDIRRGLGDEVEDPQARLISARVGGVTVLSAYIPNGATVGSQSYAYKRRWYARLVAMLARDFAPDAPLVLCGDTNVARDDADVSTPARWAASVLCVEGIREDFSRVLQWGVEDVFRTLHPEGGYYSWWDYRGGAFRKDEGLRIDHLLATKKMAERCVEAYVDRDERGKPKPSDHAPVIARFEGRS